jgi:tellurite resistance protein
MSQSIGIIFFTVVFLNITSFAHTAQCTKEAILIAKTIGFIKQDRAANIIKTAEVVSLATGEIEKQETHIYTGTAELVIILLPNYYGDGKCQYSQFYIQRD